MSGAARNFHKLDLAPSNWCCCMCSHLQGAKVIGFFQLVLGFGLILLTILAVSNDNQPTAGQPGAVLIRGLILGFGVLLVFVSSFLLVGLFKRKSFPIILWIVVQVFCIISSVIVIVLGISLLMADTEALVDRIQQAELNPVQQHEMIDAARLSKRVGGVVLAIGIFSSALGVWFLLTVLKARGEIVHSYLIPTNSSLRRKKNFV